MEIDDNIAGAGMTALDTAVFLACRKSVFERLHPEIKQGGDRRSANFENQTDIMSFCSATAEQFGLSDRHVRRLVAAGSALKPKDITALRNAPKPVRLNDLMALAKIGEADEREAVCVMIGGGEAKSVGDARKIHAGKPVPVKDPVEEAFKTMLIAWERAPKKAKRRFVRERLDDLRAAGLIDDPEAAAE